MSWLRRFFNVFRRSRVNDDIESELQFHLEMRAEDFRRAGLSEAEARREAARRLGNAASLRDRTREADILVAIDTTLQDAGYAVRLLRRSRGFTATAVLTLGLGIGATAAILSVVDAAMLRPLPFSEPDRIVAVLEQDAQRPPAPGSHLTTSQTYLDWRRMQQSFEGLAAVSPWTFDVRNERGEPDRASAFRVTWEFFPALRIQPLAGRLFTADDEIPGRHRVVLLSHGFWQRRFGGADDAVGARIAFGRQSYEIVGVLPPGFSYPLGGERPADVYVPLPFSSAAKIRADSRMHQYTAIGRLRQGVSVEQAQQDMSRLAAALDKQYPAWNQGRTVRVVALHEHLVGHVRHWMLALLGAVIFVLLIACVNVANLMIAHATTRNRELAIRAALGAGTWRLIRVLLVQGLVLSLIAVAVGVLLALAGVRVLAEWMPPDLPRIGAVAMNLRVLGASVALAIVAGCLCALGPAIQLLRHDAVPTLKDSEPSATPARFTQRLRGALLVAQVALTVALVVGAELFFASFMKLVRIDPGLDVRNVLAVGVGLPPHSGSFDEALKRSASDIQRLIDVVRGVPGVQAAGAVYGGLPLSGGWSRIMFQRPDRPGVDYEIDQRTVSAGYLETLRVPLLHGRHLSAGERDAPLVVLINQTAARRYWGAGADALNQRLTIDGKPREIVGIVGDIRHLGPEELPRPEVYIPMTQGQMIGATLVIRTGGEPMASLPAVKAAIWSVLPEQRFDSELLTLEAHMERFLVRRRFNMALLGLFAIVGLVMAAVGVHGVARFIVARRTKEIGVRLALGATPGRVVAMIVKAVALLMGAGLGLGSLVAWQVGGGVRSFLFQVEPHDPRILIGAFALLCTVGLLAAAGPVYRAVRIDPIDVLRRE